MLREEDDDVSIPLSTATGDRDVIENSVSFELQPSPQPVESQEETADENSESEYESESFVCNYCDKEFTESKPLYAHWVEMHNVCHMCLGYGFKMFKCDECGASRT